MSISRKELTKIAYNLFDEAVVILEAKNKDYANEEDVFANFRASQVLGIKPEMALLIRCLDKIARLRAFIDNGELAVKDESYRDAVVDVINYMVLLYGLFDEKVTKVADPQEDRGKV